MIVKLWYYCEICESVFHLRPRPGPVDEWSGKGRKYNGHNWMCTNCPAWRLVTFYDQDAADSAYAMGGRTAVYDMVAQELSK